MRIQSILFKYRVFRNYEKIYIQSKRRIYRYQLSAIFMSYYSPAVHTVQNSQAYNHFREIGTILVYLVFNFFVDPDPDPGKSFWSMRMRNTFLKYLDQ